MQFKVSVEVTKRSVPALSSALYDRQCGVLQKTAGMTESIMLNIFVKGDSNDFFEKYATIYEDSEGVGAIGVFEPA